MRATPKTSSPADTILLVNRDPQVVSARSRGARTITDGGAQGDVLLGSAGNLLGGHFGIWATSGIKVTWLLRMRFSKRDLRAAANLVVERWGAKRAVGCGRMFCTIESWARKKALP